MSCIDCGAPVSRRRCWSCHVAWLRRNRRPPSTCVDCGSRVTAGCQRCIECARLQQCTSSCPWCGRRLPQKDTFCDGCGKSLRDERTGSRIARVHPAPERLVYGGFEGDWHERSTCGAAVEMGAGA